MSTPTQVKYYDINEDAARCAREMNSFSEYTPGSATALYRRMVDEAAEIAEKQKKRVDPMHHERIDYLLDLYARKLAENRNNSYDIESRVPSVIIAGPANFPVRKEEKQNAAREKNNQEWQHIQGLLDKIRSTGMGGISSDDPDAIPKLEARLKALEAFQTTMKAVNAYHRKHKTLDGCPDLTPEQIEELKAKMAKDWHTQPKPYSSWELSNNNAEIRRVRQRIETLVRQRETGYIGWEFDGGEVEVNQEMNRLQILFDDKPDEEIRTALKSNGFRWAPSAGAWQRQLNDNAIRAADYVKAILPVSGDKPSELQRKFRNGEVE